MVSKEKPLFQAAFLLRRDAGSSDSLVCKVKSWLSQIRI
jgi:hypothetical protein